MGPIGSPGGWGTPGARDAAEGPRQRTTSTLNAAAAAGAGPDAESLTESKVLKVNPHLKSPIENCQKQLNNSQTLITQAQETLKTIEKMAYEVNKPTPLSKALNPGGDVLPINNQALEKAKTRLTSLFETAAVISSVENLFLGNSSCNFSLPSSESIIKKALEMVASSSDGDDGPNDEGLSALAEVFASDHPEILLLSSSASLKDIGLYSKLTDLIKQKILELPAEKYEIAISKLENAASIKSKDGTNKMSDLADLFLQDSFKIPSKVPGAVTSEKRAALMQAILDNAFTNHEINIKQVPGKPVYIIKNNQGDGLLVFKPAGHRIDNSPQFLNLGTVQQTNTGVNPHNPLFPLNTSHVRSLVVFTHPASLIHSSLAITDNKPGLIQTFIPGWDGSDLVSPTYTKTQSRSADIHSLEGADKQLKALAEQVRFDPRAGHRDRERGESVSLIAERLGLVDPKTRKDTELNDKMEAFKNPNVQKQIQIEGLLGLLYHDTDRGVHNTHMVLSPKYDLVAIYCLDRDRALQEMPGDSDVETRADLYQNTNPAVIPLHEDVLKLFSDTLKNPQKEIERIQVLFNEAKMGASFTAAQKKDIISRALFIGFCVEKRMTLQQIDKALKIISPKDPTPSHPDGSPILLVEDLPGFDLSQNSLSKDQIKYLGRYLN